MPERPPRFKTEYEVFLQNAAGSQSLPSSLGWRCGPRTFIRARASGCRKRARPGGSPRRSASNAGPDDGPLSIESQVLLIWRTPSRSSNPVARFVPGPTGRSTCRPAYGEHRQPCISRRSLGRSLRRTAEPRATQSRDEIAPPLRRAVDPRVSTEWPSMAERQGFIDNVKGAEQSLTWWQPPSPIQGLRVRRCRRAKPGEVERDRIFTYRYGSCATRIRRILGVGRTATSATFPHPLMSAEFEPAKSFVRTVAR